MPLFSRRKRLSEADAADLVNHEFRSALLGAQLRAGQYGPLIDGVAAALARASGQPAGLDASGPFDAATFDELQATIKLSAYLRRDLSVIVDRFRREEATLAAAERAAERLEAEPGLRTDPEALSRLYSLFWGLDQASGLFADYPAVERQFRLAAQPAPPPVAPLLAAQAELVGWFTEAPLDHAAAEPADDAWRWTRLLPAWLRPAEPEPLYPEHVGAAALFQDIAVPALTLELGAELVPLIDPSFGGDLLERFQPVRRVLALETGFIVPGVQVVDNFALRPNTYRIRVRMDQVAQGTLLAGYQLALRVPNRDYAHEDPPIATMGFPAADPRTGEPGAWVAGYAAERALALGYHVRDPIAVILDHLADVIRAYAAELLAFDDVAIMLNLLRERRPEISATVPLKLDLAEYHQVLRRLLAERVCIRDQEAILEALNHHLTPVREPGNLSYNVMVDPSQLGAGGPIERVRASLKLGPEDLAEVVRKRLARQLCEALADNEGVIEVADLKPQVEDMVLSSLTREGATVVLALRADSEERLLRAIAQAVEGLDRPALLCDPAIRAHVRRLVARTRPDVAVLARDEIHPAFRTSAANQVSLLE